MIEIVAGVDASPSARVALSWPAEQARMIGQICAGVNGERASVAGLGGWHASRVSARSKALHRSAAQGSSNG